MQNKSRQIRLTNDINKALDLLKSKGVNTSKFIREAVEEKLYKDLRKILKEVEKEKQKEYCPF